MITGLDNHVWGSGARVLGRPTLAEVPQAHYCVDSEPWAAKHTVCPSQLTGEVHGAWEVQMALPLPMPARDTARCWSQRAL